MQKKELGQLGEKAAQRYLREEKGYRIRCCNYRSRVGEIDIIAEDGSVLVFVEVKTRTSSEFGRPCEAVERHKRRKITRIADNYLARYQLWERPCRFDVVEVYAGAETGAKVRIRHLPQAFLAERR